MARPAGSQRSWAVLLAGPAVGSAHFFLVYLAAEASCAEGWRLLSTATLRALILATTAGAVAVLAVLALLAAIGPRRRAGARTAAGGPPPGEVDENRRFMAVAAATLAGLFVVFVLFVGAPAVGSSLC
jgi:hypothetical protein